jgi:hypothetical protein
MARFRKTYGFEIPTTGTPYKPAISMRVLSVRMWGLDKQPITMGVFNALSDDEVKYITDYGSGINFSHVGWRFGTEMSTTSYIEGSAKKVVWVSSVSNILLYCRVLVRFDSLDTSTGVFNSISAARVPHNQDPTWIHVPMGDMSV